MNCSRFLPRCRLDAAALIFLAAAYGCGGDAGPAEAKANVAAVPSLLQSLKLRDATARSRAAVALGKMGPAAKDAVPALTACLRDRDLTVRAAAAHALGRIGPDAKSASSELKGLVKQAATREVAAEALERIGD